MSNQSVNFKVLVCALIALAPNALLLRGFDVAAAQAQAQAQAQTAALADDSVDTSTVGTVLVE